MTPHQQKLIDELRAIDPDAAAHYTAIILLVLSSLIPLDPNSIRGAFLWDDSPQGSVYWDQIDDKLKAHRRRNQIMGEKIFKLWIRVEVYDPDKDDHQDLDPDQCEFKLFEGSQEEAIDFIADHCYEPKDEIAHTIEHCLKLLP